MFDYYTDFTNLYGSMTLRLNQSKNIQRIVLLTISCFPIFTLQAYKQKAGLT
ncbi:Hypothetical protein PMT_2283 [Prochlorococcus marinus str. MIT 9313]|uniref:Uncharacterized protein n=1 Tax=Prochlorococcus marinus (strain MIT 9313) TaxID=74547 RepID=B9ERC2_PROMM|nr:Hypothetical protein PMT_2283 [Prochlorococcus marinus str. MIT 9313]